MASTHKFFTKNPPPHPPLITKREERDMDLVKSLGIIKNPAFARLLIGLNMAQEIGLATLCLYNNSFYKICQVLKIRWRCGELNPEDHRWLPRSCARHPQQKIFYQNKKVL